MCGICLALRIPIQNHLFNFDFFEQYGSPSEKHLPLNQHIINNKLQLPSHLVPAHLLNQLTKRGPDRLTISQIQLYKTTFESISLLQKQNQKLQIAQGTALAFQSTLHLRGSSIYQSTTPGSFMLYNGQIYDSGSLQPIQTGQNDAQWLHKQLIECKGSQERMVQMLQEIRGDYAVVLVEGDKILLLKDYFGKRSMLTGMSANSLIISSVPTVGEKQKEKDCKEKQGQKDCNANEDEGQGDSWKQKYEAQWLSSRNKNFFEIPRNSLISITLRNNQAIWEHYPIFHPHLLRDINKIKNRPEQETLAVCKKLFIQGVLELTRCIKYVGGGRLLNQRQHQKQQHCAPSVAVLFSGGVDSTLIARVLDLVLPKNEQIDLVNLAFRQDAPDRETGKLAYQQLKALSPHRKYNLILVDRTLQDIEPLKKALTESIYPKTTHMDFNIATALHVASKQTKARIILTGLGADQVFSGYSRYRIAFKRGGFPEMQNEMLFDMERLWIRNLGRDDRAVSSNGKEVRYPFLYMPLWKFLRTVELPQLTDGSGEKQLLRKLAAKEFGLQKAATFKKKAIQFGTRLAKLSNVKSFGSNRKAKGVYQYHK